MKVIQVTIDEPLLMELDKAAACDGKARSVLVRDAVAKMLRKRHFEEAERAERESYEREPDDATEVEAWVPLQDWGEE
jgi:metal-responsive CopG/Arc/MetJ family transcriptional regulator